MGQMEINSAPVEEKSGSTKESLSTFKILLLSPPSKDDPFSAFDTADGGYIEFCGKNGEPVDNHFSLKTPQNKLNMLIRVLANWIAVNMQIEREIFPDRPRTRVVKIHKEHGLYPILTQKAKKHGVAVVYTELGEDRNNCRVHHFGPLNGEWMKTQANKKKLPENYRKLYKKHLNKRRQILLDNNSRVQETEPQVQDEFLQKVKKLNEEMEVIQKQIMSELGIASNASADFSTNFIKLRNEVASIQTEINKSKTKGNNTALWLSLTIGAALLGGGLLLAPLALEMGGVLAVVGEELVAGGLVVGEAAAAFELAGACIGVSLLCADFTSTIILVTPEIKDAVGPKRRHRLMQEEHNLELIRKKYSRHFRKVLNLRTLLIEKQREYHTVQEAGLKSLVSNNLFELSNKKNKAQELIVVSRRLNSLRNEEHSREIWLKQLELSVNLHFPGTADSTILENKYKNMTPDLFVVELKSFLKARRIEELSPETLKQIALFFIVPIGYQSRSDIADLLKQAGLKKKNVNFILRSSDALANTRLNANSKELSPEGIFRVEHYDNDLVSFVSARGLYLSQLKDVTDIAATSVISLSDQKFTFEKVKKNKFALKRVDGKYISAVNGGGGELKAADEIGENELFKYQLLGGGRVAIKTAKGFYLSVPKSEFFN
eukprot:snap_masked-scaffold_35-processed-gene-0.22-mRNA-1 protein AED:1.00 eAED:1.00 QI:0/-1/0/0/-1/1/1/0/660